MPRGGLISFCFAAVAVLSLPADAFSFGGIEGGRRSTSLHMYEQEGCAAKPFEKKKICVFGAGGYLGATIFGFLQRAGALYGTGLSGQSSPRAISATSSSAEALNKVLGSAFKLAFAGEDLVRLIDTSDVDHIIERVQTYDAAVIGTVYQLEKRTVTLNTYEKSPNDRTYDFYLDEKYGAWENDVPSDDSDYHIQIFKNSVQALVEAGSFKHVVVVETQRTCDPMAFINILEEAEIPYTYLRIKGKLIKDLSFSFDKGVKDSLAVSKYQPEYIYPIEAEVYENERPVYREDVAALIVQSLMSLNWNNSRILEVASSPNPLNNNVPTKRQRTDRDWCANSDLLANSLNAETISPAQIKEFGISTQR